MTRHINIVRKDSDLFSDPVDYRTGKLRTFTNSETEVRVVLYQDGSLADASSLSSGVCELKALGASGGAPAHDAAAVVSKTDNSPDNTTTVATWSAGTKQHITFTFTDSNLDIAAGTYWLSCYVTTSGGATVVLFGGKIDILNPGTEAGL